MFASRKIEALNEKLEIQHNYVMKLAHRIELLEGQLHRTKEHYDKILKDTREKLHKLEIKFEEYMCK